jgi:hypothetical protein
MIDELSKSIRIDVEVIVMNEGEPFKKLVEDRKLSNFAILLGGTVH